MISFKLCTLPTATNSSPLRYPCASLPAVQDFPRLSPLSHKFCSPPKHLNQKGKSLLSDATALSLTLSPEPTMLLFSLLSRVLNRSRVEEITTTTPHATIRSAWSLNPVWHSLSVGRVWFVGKVRIKLEGIPKAVFKLRTTACECVCSCFSSESERTLLLLLVGGVNREDVLLVPDQFGC